MKALVFWFTLPAVLGVAGIAGWIAWRDSLRRMWAPADDDDATADAADEWVRRRRVMP